MADELHALSGIMPDVWIRHMAEHHGMIEPFVGEKVRTELRDAPAYSAVMNVGPLKTEQKVISYGLSSMGYDLRVADDFKVFTNVYSAIVDPKKVDTRAFVTRQGDGYCMIPPNSFALARSVERFKLPADVLMMVLGKSTYARIGIVVNVTPGEPGWEGYLTLEISNTTPLPAKVYANEGLCQCLFFKSGVPCITPYGEDGRYQNQGPEIVLPR